MMTSHSKQYELSKSRVKRRQTTSKYWLNFVLLTSLCNYAVSPVAADSPQDVSWWRHQMEKFSALLALCATNSPVPRWIPRTKASDAELWCFLWYAWINDWVNNREAGDLRRYRTHYDVIVTWWTIWRNNTVFALYIIAYTMKLLIHSKTSMLKRRTVPKGRNWQVKWPRPALFERRRGFYSNYRAILKSIVILSRFCKRKWSPSSSLNAKMNT